ncbi:3'3'-cGAMP-specific phosphodiesterase 3 [bacterium HR29]|jgi:HD-GYP domain-containing protein (c-di-GMP phosphodiesterase class II)|nr:3'3'-cGAMP-specific phosphodiesterase 3 [bacterium HR29]
MTTSPIEALGAEFLDPILYEEPAPALNGALSRATLLTGLSRAFDLAEGRRPGHAQRLAFVGLTVAAAIELEPSLVEASFFACLLHDLGMAAGRVPPDVGQAPWRSKLELMTAHAALGARFARRLGLSESVAEGIATHHHCWRVADGQPALPEQHFPIAGRIAALADRFDALLEQARSPLFLRKEAPRLLRDMAGNEVDPDLAEVLARIVSEDDFWLRLFDNDLATSLMALNYGGILSEKELFETLGVIADLVDLRNQRPQDSGRRVARLAYEIARRWGMPEERAKLVHAAALLHDIGTLGVPVQFLAKPDILTVHELTAVQLHPVYARDILSEVPGFGAIAWWVGCHHERIDGKGYPGMLEGAEVPIESQIIGLAEAYLALTSERPYRKAMPPEEAFLVLEGQAGSRFDGALLEHLVDAVHDAMAGLH